MYRSSRKKPSVRQQTPDVESDEGSKSHDGPSETPCNVQKKAKSDPYLFGIYLMLTVLIVLLSLVASGTVTVTSNQGWWILVYGVSIPILFACYTIFKAPEAHSRIIALALVSAVLCNQLPSQVSAGVASTSLCLFGLATRPGNTTISKSADKGRFSLLDPRSWSGQVRAIAAALLLVVVLLVDNFFVWVVAATYHPSHSLQNYPEPLQDNGRIVLTWLLESLLQLQKSHVIRLRAVFNVQWALVSAMAASFVCCELKLVQVHQAFRTLWGVCIRSLLTLAAARAVRVMSFLLTVLPSQVPYCYRHHFPYPPPQDWIGWFKVGLIPQSHGGCNDLIVSGHATVTSILACMATSVASNAYFSMALWSLLALDYCVEVYEGFHYSVDMWMGALVTTMLFRIFSVLEETEPVGKQPQDSFVPLSLQTLSTRDALRYAIPAFGAYVTVMVFAEAAVNYAVMVYSIYSVVVTVRVGFTQHTQHVLLCTLYMALAVYL